MEYSKSLAPHTGKVFESISRLECITPYTLVGGTALSLQIGKRQSEDLDFMKWVKKRNEKPEVAWPTIMKEMETMLRRSKFRDYYDIYSILKEGKDLQKMIDAAIEHSGHKLRTRGLLSMLTNGGRFIKEKGFEELLPVYDVTPYDIQEYIKQRLLEIK